MPFSVHLSLKKNSSRLANQSGALLMAEGECLLLAHLGLGQHFSGLLTGGGVYVEVLEEDLGAYREMRKGQREREAGLKLEIKAIR